MNNKFCIIDLEIIKAIPPKNHADRIPGIQYCDGWTDFKNMGISSIALSTELVAHDWDLHSCKDHIDGLVEDGWLIGGFNSLKFDDRLLRANGLHFYSDFDILEMVLMAAGMDDVNYWELDKPRSYSLNNICNANGLIKTGSGSEAPIWWQQGDYERVHKYCHNDVCIELAVLDRLLVGGLIDPNTGDLLSFDRNHPYFDISRMII